MTKLLSLSVVLILLVLSLAACGSETPPTVRVGGLTGPTSIAVQPALRKRGCGCVWQGDGVCVSTGAFDCQSRVRNHGPKHRGLAVVFMITV